MAITDRSADRMFATLDAYNSRPTRPTVAIVFSIITAALSILKVGDSFGFGEAVYWAALALTVVRWLGFLWAWNKRREEREEAFRGIASRK